MRWADRETRQQILTAVVKSMTFVELLIGWNQCLDRNALRRRLR